ncbi:MULTISPECIES: hypothetical protein [unclassified Rickettsia]|uniref:hypothetical protein n=1 Tax=unclassified Rickettsia TaxID=114295 RepID=UPI003132CA02
MLNLLQHDKVKAGLPFLGVVAAHNLLYYGYYKYGVMPRYDTELLCKNSSHATTPIKPRNDTYSFIDRIDADQFGFS